MDLQNSALLTVMMTTLSMALVIGQMDAGDLSILLEFAKGLQDPSLLGWNTTNNGATTTDACSWKGIQCQGTFVSAIYLPNLNLSGTVTPNLNRLLSLNSLSLQFNDFAGALPSLSGLSNLHSCYLHNNLFDTIPFDFFFALPSLQSLYLNNNPSLNASSGGWSLISPSLQASSSLTNLSLTNTSLIGTIPDFLGALPSLAVLNLAYNRLQGSIPQSFRASNLQQFQANNQLGPRLSGNLDVVGKMQSLRQLWLHVNAFSGIIPAGLANCVSLTDLRLNDNQLVGPISESFSNLQLSEFAVENNQLDGPIPVIGGNFTYSNNYFCQNASGVACQPQVTALLAFLESVNYPQRIVSSWKGNNPCSSWFGISCDSTGNVVVVNLANSNLSGVINSSIAQLTSLSALKLNRNNLTGSIPSALGSLLSLKSLDVSYNNLTGPVPMFPANVTIDTSGNPLINVILPPPSSSESTTGSSRQTRSHFSHITSIVAPLLGALLVLFLAAIAFFVLRKRYPKKFEQLRLLGRLPAHAPAPEAKPDAGALGFEVGNLVISAAELRKATNNFNEENFLGRGGFGSVYRGQLEDGTVVAVKRMEAAVVASKGLKEFQAEIAVLTKVRHRHLVALLGYCVEGNEKLLVYEYMPGGTLSQHLFDFAKHHKEPLSWKHRLSIALDVARGMEYLHGLAQMSFIHRDLKPSNILLDDNIRAKVSDFGLVKLAPEGGKHSVETRVAGTFGYLAPEYAVTGRISTKADVFSFGVVLMELVTGRPALDDTQTEEKYHLVPWFRRVIGNKEELLKIIDPKVDAVGDVIQGIYSVAELAGYCTVREPLQRPDMSHAVNILAPLVQEWKPTDEVEDGSEPIFGYEEARKFLECSTSSIDFHVDERTFP